MTTTYAFYCSIQFILRYLVWTNPCKIRKNWRRLQTDFCSNEKDIFEKKYLARTTNEIHLICFGSPEINWCGERSGPGALNLTRVDDKGGMLMMIKLIIIMMRLTVWPGCPGVSGCSSAKLAMWAVWLLIYTSNTTVRSCTALCIQLNWEREQTCSWAFVHVAWAGSEPKSCRTASDLTSPNMLPQSPATSLHKYQGVSHKRLELEEKTCCHIAHNTAVELFYIPIFIVSAVTIPQTFIPKY